MDVIECNWIRESATGAAQKMFFGLVEIVDEVLRPNEGMRSSNQDELIVLEIFCLFGPGRLLLLAGFVVGEGPTQNGSKLAQEVLKRGRFYENGLISLFFLRLTKEVPCHSHLCAWTIPYYFDRVRFIGVKVMRWMAHRKAFEESRKSDLKCTAFKVSPFAQLLGIF